MLESIISADEIQRDRTPATFVAWFDAFLEKTRVDRSNREQILLRQGIAKPVYEEVFPLYRLLQQKQAEWSDRKFRNVLGNQSYDVIVSGPSDSYVWIAHDSVVRRPSFRSLNCALLLEDELAQYKSQAKKTVSSSVETPVWLPKVNL